MKRKFHHPEPTAREQAAPTYWRSPGELAKTPEFQQWLEREFPEGSTEANETDRRSFLKLMGASAGLAGIGLTGCRMPVRHIMPYSKQPELMVPGVPMYYASSFPGSQENIPLIVETNDARPTKIEGNPSDPGYAGATDSFAQASVLDLYDPDRLQKSFQKGGKPVDQASIRSMLANLQATYAANKGKGLAILAQPATSPTRRRLVASLKKQFPEVIWAEYEPVDTSAPTRAIEKLTGKPLRPFYQVDQAHRILALDSDFLATEPGHIHFSKGFGKGRAVKDSHEVDQMNRLYAVESNFSLTGGMADHRLRAATAHIPAFTALVAAALMEQSGMSAELVDKLKAQGKGLEVDQKWINECVKDLLANKGKSLIVAGPHLPEEVHVLVFAMNGVLGADGHTVKYIEQPAFAEKNISDVAAGLNDGSIKTLVVLGGNPAYDAPADLKFAEAMGKAEQVIRHGYYGDETSELASVTIASTHYLESWDDGRAICGDYLPVQPMILPLFQGFSEIEVMALMQGIDPAGNGYELVKETFGEVTGKTDDLSFETWLAEGVWLDARYPAATIGSEPAVKAGQMASAMSISAPKVSAEELEVRIIPSTHAYDGRYNNNGWLMECPDPMTKLTWDNAILVSPKLGKKLGITPSPILMDKLGELHMNANQFKQGKEEAHIGTIEVNGHKVTGPMHILPGLADSTVVVSLGFGRRKTGRIGTDIYYPNVGKGIGFDAYPLTSTDSMALATGAKLTKSEETFKLANTQEHWSMEGRAIIREANKDEYKENPGFVNEMGVESHSPPIYGAARNDSAAEKALDIPRGGSSYKTPAFGEPAPNVSVWNTEEGKAQYQAPQQWGMNIDLNTCTACNACVIACQSENNIPIVGKDQVLRGREMHWIRLDRYFATDPGADTTEIPEDPQVNFMSMACQHCELAPCESVCPVNATVHDEQGLNVMAYNRCVGTRYCANNCPYKVRRFNFFDFNKRERADLYAGPLGPNKYETEASQLTRMQKNPNVTVRMRGVMEKCTYCLQRIEMAKINQKNKAKDSANTRVKDGTIKVACQQVCPTEAITFGDVADPESAVSKAKSSDRNYAVLGYLNVRPRTTYLAKLRNPNPAISKAKPLSRQEYDAKSGHGGHDESHDTHSEEHATTTEGQGEAKHEAHSAEKAHH
ncbi:TAT-variant-translocated molybdopterin oxidoreductase [Cerasicoccus arenae]|uniref:Molybdopterin oxidoreductase n=1 Tax=Cerasicoccus arenae TaxID=424488 RepID=A0A8J3DJA9_9BACT|nr:TAT-variant-translocated molybdopterin oxidoreductase [Cerasicoccus arenae]MBK1858537.1 TAT-variant-translocated molybdopterin oxidoreductase [Cerasicoccus arenae]GHC06156.1 molybdopterin oxidoreductase [Cerasicoccus arenae]